MSVCVFVQFRRRDPAAQSGVEGPGSHHSTVLNHASVWARVQAQAQHAIFSIFLVSNAVKGHCVFFYYLILNSLTGRNLTMNEEPFNEMEKAGYYMFC